MINYQGFHDLKMVRHPESQRENPEGVESPVPTVLSPGHISAAFDKRPEYINSKNCPVWLSKFQLDSCGYLQRTRALTSADLKGLRDSQQELGLLLAASD